MDRALDPDLKPTDVLGAGVVQIESTVVLDRDDLDKHADLFATSRGSNTRVVAGADAGSLSAELFDLRRTRIGACAIFLAITYVILAFFIYLSDNGIGWEFTLLMALRSVIAATVASLVFSPIRFSRRGIRTLEYSLFGGVTLVLCISQYVSILYLINEDLPIVGIMIAKNGVIQLIAIMVLYGLFIPNKAKHTACVVLAMSFALALAQALVAIHPKAEPILKAIQSGERLTDNSLFILIGAALAIYGAHILNGLRTELHEARKFGQYRLGRKIGAGGMGEVYLAEHELLKRPCALKLIKPEAGSDPLALARFEREVRSSARLNHPNTIEIFDYGHTRDGTFYYVMELLSGMSLGDLIEKYGPLPPGRLIYLMRQVCAGLSQAHGLGLVHRDLKPANIFIAEIGGGFDFAKVLDFGLVKITKDPDAVELTAERTISGTPMFMAPEQAAGEKSVGTQADIYAMGAIAFYAITGRPPFEGNTPWAVMIAHARDPVVPPSKVRDGVPHDLEQVILHCLEKKPQNRYQDIKSLSRALAACRSAADWSEEQAEVWWNKVEQAGAKAVGA